MRATVIALLLGLAALALVPAATASHLPTTGTRIGLFRGNCSGHNPNVPANVEITFAANTDFFIRHGWSLPWSDATPEQKQAELSDNTRFDLYVDGVKVASQLDLDFQSSDGTVTLAKTHLTNFPGGMTGTHEFRGLWYIDGLLIGETPGTAVFQLACALEVQFV